MLRVQSNAARSLVKDLKAFRCINACRFYSGSIRTDVVQLAYDKHETKGPAKGDPIVFLHGLFGSKTNTRTVSRVLARDLQRNIFCLDLRNHGDSPHTKVHDYPSMAKDVMHWLDQHKIGPSVLIGHSMGAKVAMAVALENPGAVSKLIPVDNSPIDASLSGNFPVYVKAMIEVARAKPQNQSDMFDIISKYEKSLPVQQFLLSNFKRNHQTHIYEPRIPLDVLGRAIAMGNLGDFPYHPDQYQYKKPTMFIRGTESKYVPDEAIPLIGQFFPRFIIKDIKCGHWVISEKPQEFLRDVKEFLVDDE